MNREEPAITASSILLIDDDIELLELLSDYLRGEGFTVECVHDGNSGLSAVLTGHYDIVVLDVMMPGMSGIQVLSQIRSETDIPVIMLTARGEETDRIMGLELGADDYVPKPCAPRELVARLRAILKRIGTQAKLSPSLVTQPISIGTLTLWPAQRRAADSGRPLELTSTEFSLLEILANRAGQPVSKQELSENVLGRPLTRFDRSIDVHISNIRRKLGHFTDNRSRIQAVIHKGYQLIIE